jgi:hypothetical protein
MNRLILVFVVILISLKPISLYSQKNNTAAIAAGALIGGAAIGLLAANSVENVKEGFERRMVEWVLSNKQMSKPVEFELKLIKWDITKKEDFSNVTVIGFFYKERDSAPVVLLNACSPGWINDNGVDFSYVDVYEITQDLWSRIMINYLNLAKSSEMETVTDINKIPTLSKGKAQVYVPFYMVESISSSSLTFYTENNGETKFYFKSLANGDVHLANDFDKDFVIDFNEANMNIYLKSTGDLIKLKRNFLIDITKRVFQDKIPITVY